MLIAQHLNFDVARVDDELLDKAAVIAKRRFGFGAGKLEAFLGFLGVVGDAHAFAAAAGRGLDHHGIADLIGNLDRMFAVSDHTHVTWNGRDLGGGCRLFALDFVAHGGDGFGVRANEDDAGLLQGGWKRLALRQEPVAGVNSFGTGLLTGVDDLVHEQIRLRRGRRPDVDRFIRHFDVQRVAVGIGIDGNRFDPHLARGFDNAAGNLATVGDQNLFEHRARRSFWGKSDR